MKSWNLFYNGKNELFLYIKLPINARAKTLLGSSQWRGSIDRKRFAVRMLISDNVFEELKKTSVKVSIIKLYLLGLNIFNEKLSLFIFNEYILQIIES